MDRWHLGMALGALSVLVLGALGCEGRDARLAREWQQGCAKGDLSACAEFGEACQTGIGVPKDAARGARVFEEACAAGGVRACTLLGLSYLKGNGVPKNAARADDLFGKACDAGDGGACVHGCDDTGDAMRCLRVAVLSQNGGMDLQRASAYFGKACDRGHPLGCRELAKMFEIGSGVPKDAARAAGLSAKAKAAMKTACGGPNKPDYCEL
jgi:TPR repeat protein